jgi:invasion protein IalB
MRSASLAVALVSLSSTLALAQEPRLLGTHETWSAWSFRENKAKVCYVYADASKKNPEHLDHGRVSLFVRRLNGGKIRSEASLQTGYNFAPSAIRVAVDGKRFTMLPRGNSAWLRHSEREHEFVDALTKGQMLTVEAVSRRGNKTSYAFSLKGSRAAMGKARRECR